MPSEVPSYGAVVTRNTEAGTSAPPEVATPPNIRRVTNATLQSLLSFYRSLHEEYDYFLPQECIDGEVPAELKGTLLRNGPGQLEVFGSVLSQPFDGDGMICRFSFADGAVHFSNRFVRTKAFQEEQAAKKLLYAGAFASGRPSGQWFNNPFTIKVKNVANTGVLQWGGRLLALHESGLPYEMRLGDLSTVGETNLDGAIDREGPFAAHYRIMHQPDGTQRLVTFGVQTAGLDANVSFFEFGDNGALLHKTKLPIKSGAFGFFHDLAVSEHYYVLFQNPTKLDLRKLLFEYVPGKCGIAECIIYDESLPTRVHLIPRPASGTPSSEPRVFETDAFFSFHHANAFEDGSQVVIDTVAWDTISFSMSLDTVEEKNYSGGQRTELCRVVVDTATGAVTRRSLSHRTCEFPLVAPTAHGRPHRHIYAPASCIDHPVWWGPAQVIVKTSFPEGVPPATAQPTFDVWEPGPTKFTQEPLFVPRPGGTAEDDGWLLVMVNDGDTQKTSLCILDAQHVSAGPVCTLRMPHHVPPGLHGSWTSELAKPPVPPQGAPRHWQPTFSTISH